MELEAYVTETLYHVLRGISKADQRLLSENLGRVWRDDFSTHSSSLISLRIAKGQTLVDGERRSQPVLIFDFDVNVSVEESHEVADSAEVSARAGFLKVVSMTGKVSGTSGAGSAEKSVQNIKFCVPVSLTI